MKRSVSPLKNNNCNVVTRNADVGPSMTQALSIEAANRILFNSDEHLRTKLTAKINEYFQQLNQMCDPHGAPRSIVQIYEDCCRRYLNGVYMNNDVYNECVRIAYMPTIDYAELLINTYKDIAYRLAVCALDEQTVTSHPKATKIWDRFKRYYMQIYGDSLIDFHKVPTTDALTMDTFFDAYLLLIKSSRMFAHDWLRDAHIIDYVVKQFSISQIEEYNYHDSHMMCAYEHQQSIFYRLFHSNAEELQSYLLQRAYDDYIASDQPLDVIKLNCIHNYVAQTNADSLNTYNYSSLFEEALARACNHYRFEKQGYTQYSMNEQDFFRSIYTISVKVDRKINAKLQCVFEKHKLAYTISTLEKLCNMLHASISEVDLKRNVSKKQAVTRDDIYYGVLAACFINYDYLVSTLIMIIESAI